ncbi:MAG: hypothetical protein AB1796_04955 [Bacillota bacterium]
MSQDFVTGKRYPRSLTRRMSILNGEKSLSCSYLDLSHVPIHSSEAEYNSRLAEIKKMANIP